MTDIPDLHTGSDTNVDTDGLLEITVRSFSRMLDNMLNMIGARNGEQVGGGHEAALGALRDYADARNMEITSSSLLPAGLLYAAAGLDRPEALGYWIRIPAGSVLDKRTLSSLQQI